MTSPTEGTATHSAAQPHDAGSSSTDPSPPIVAAGPSASSTSATAAADSAASTPLSPTVPPSTAPPSTITTPTQTTTHTAAQKGPRQFDEVSIQYSSFPSAQSPQLTGIVPPPPARPFPFSHEDTEKSRLAYESLAANAKAYRVALGQLSAAASNFGAALETCARLKEARAQPYPPGPYMPPAATGMYASTISLNGGGAGGGPGGRGSTAAPGSEVSCTADVLLATSGLYYLMANQQGILAETVYRSFELPIVHELDRYTSDVEAEQESYASGIRDASKDIRKLEKEGVKLRKPRQRDVVRMRSHLVTMTAALDALTARQGAHAVALLDQSRDMSGTVAQAGRNLVRAEMDILDGLARKGWPGGGLDGVLEGAVDLFSRGSEEEEDLLASSAVITGAGPSGFTGVSDLGLGPKLLLLGGGPVSTGLSRPSTTPVSGTGGLGYGNDDASDAATIEGTIIGGSRGTTGTSAAGGSGAGAGKVFSILPGGILNETGHLDQRSLLSNDDTPSEKRGRSHKKKKKRAKAVAHRHAGNGGDDDADETEHTAPASESRHERADSLTVDTGSDRPYYQSLDGVANGGPGEAAGGGGGGTADYNNDEDDDEDGDYVSIEKKGASSIHSSTNKKTTTISTTTTGRRRGLARPFSPERVAVGPHEDVFTGSSGALEKSSSTIKAAHSATTTTTTVTTTEESTSEEKGKAAEEEAPTPAQTDTEEESSRDGPETEDEGVQAWRRDDA